MNAEGAKTVTYGGMWLGIGGIVALCGWQISNLLFPSSLSPNHVFSTSFDKIRENDHVIGRLGRNVKAYGFDHGGRREGRRNFVTHDIINDDDGVPHCQVKYTIEGDDGRKGTVYASMKKGAESGMFDYIILEIKSRSRNEAVALIDNRVRLSREEVQEKVATRLGAQNVELYGREDDQWTLRQKGELGDFFHLIKYFACDKASNKKKCEEAQLKGYPTWRFQEQNMAPGYKGLEELRTIAKQLP